MYEPEPLDVINVYLAKKQNIPNTQEELRKP